MMDISQALKNPGQYYPFKAELELPEVEVLDDPVRFEGVSLEGTYVGGEDTVRLEGTVRAVAHTRCSDCLEPAQVALEGDFDVTFARNPDPEDPDLYPIEGYRIDIAPMAQEALLLDAGAVPRGLQRPLPHMRTKSQYCTLYMPGGRRTPKQSLFGIE